MSETDKQQALLDSQLHLKEAEKLLAEKGVRKVWYAPFMKQAYGQEEIDEVVKALNGGLLAGGEWTKRFESQVASIFRKKFALLVNSGSSANMLAAVAAGVRSDVEVITPACTFSTTVSPLTMLGAQIRFCDVECNTYNTTVDMIMAEVTDRTGVIFIPNLLGNKIDWAGLRAALVKIGRTDIVLVEDSCDTMMASEHSDISTVSFYASHIITAGGCGGMVLFNDEARYVRAIRCRDWGRVGTNSEDVADRFKDGLIDGIQYDYKFVYCELGFNFKLSEMNAAFGCVQLGKLPENAATRRRLFDRYLTILKQDPHASRYYGFPVEHFAPNETIWLAFPLLAPDRGEVLPFLEGRFIQTRVTMAGNILRHPLYKATYPEQAKRSFPQSDKVMREGFLVGCHHGMIDEDVDRVCSVLIEFAKKKLET